MIEITKSPYQSPQWYLTFYELQVQSCPWGMRMQELTGQYKKYHCAPTSRSSKATPGAMPPPANPIPLPPAKRQFLSSLLDVLVRQLAWPHDADWEAPGTEDPDPGDDMAMFQNLRIVNSSPCSLKLG